MRYPPSGSGYSRWPCSRFHEGNWSLCSWLFGVEASEIIIMQLELPELWLGNGLQDKSHNRQLKLNLNPPRLSGGAPPHNWALVREGPPHGSSKIKRRRLPASDARHLEPASVSSSRRVRARPSPNTHSWHWQSQQSQHSHRTRHSQHSKHSQPPQPSQP